MDPMPGAIEAVHTLAEHYDVYVLSTAPWANPSAWSDKVGWIQRHFGSHEDSVLYKRLILSHHKDLNRGDFLVDDRLHKNGADRFVGTALEFGSDEWPDWATVVDYLTDRAPVAEQWDAGIQVALAQAIATAAHQRTDRQGWGPLHHSPRPGRGPVRSGDAAAGALCGVASRRHRRHRTYVRRPAGNRGAHGRARDRRPSHAPPWHLVG